jgi:hypothetical protein
MALCLTCWAAAAKQDKVGDVLLNLPPPTGYCDLNGRIRAMPACFP